MSGDIIQTRLQSSAYREGKVISLYSTGQNTRLSLPFDKVSEVIDRDGRAQQTVAGKDMVNNGSTVILKERKRDCRIIFLYCNKVFALLDFFLLKNSKMFFSPSYMYHIICFLLCSFLFHSLLFNCYLLGELSNLLLQPKTSFL